MAAFSDIARLRKLRCFEFSPYHFDPSIRHALVGFLDWVLEQFPMQRPCCRPWEPGIYPLVI